MTKKDIKKLDKIWSKKVKEKAGYKCEVCLEEDVWLNSCHIIGRRYRATRWGAWIDDKYDLCGFCACYGCHNQYDEHGPKEAFIRRVVIGDERYEKIRNIARTTIAKHQNAEEIEQWIATAPTARD